MKLKVNGEIVDFSKKSLIDQRVQLKKWNELVIKPEIECFCMESHDRHPPLYVNRRPNSNGTTTYFLANKSNHTVPHDSNCILNLKYKAYLSDRGIKIDEEGIMHCRLTFAAQKKKSQKDMGDVSSTKTTNSNPPSEKLNARLSSLFLALLQKSEANVHLYKPGQVRNISSRLYAAAAKTKIGSHFLIGDGHYRVYVARYKLNKTTQTEEVSEIKRSQQLIIGWGSNDSDVEEDGYYVKIPLYSVDGPVRLVTSMKVYKPVYNRALKRIKEEMNYNAVKSGYWVLWREKGNKYIECKELIFVPAEASTRIPVESQYEEEMLQELISKERTFKKPLIGNVLDLNIEDRPDFILLDRKPNVIIEVAGMETEKYLNNLRKKERMYKKNGYSYLAWQPYINELTDLKWDNY